MHKLDNGYKQRYNKYEMDKLFKHFTDNTYKCTCGHSITLLYPEDKIICSYCGKYVFKNKKEEFKYRLKEML